MTVPLPLAGRAGHRSFWAPISQRPGTAGHHLPFLFSFLLAGAGKMPPRRRQKNNNKIKEGDYGECTRRGFNRCLRNKSLAESKSIPAACLCLCASGGSHHSCFLSPYFSHIPQQVAARRGNHGNKRGLYDKICCMCEKTSLGRTNIIKDNKMNHKINSKNSSYGNKWGFNASGFAKLTLFTVAASLCISANTHSHTRTHQQEKKKRILCPGL